MDHQEITDLSDIVGRPPRLRSNFDPLLFRVSSAIAEEGRRSPIVGALCGVLRRYLEQSDGAVGLAAPQLGYPVRVIAVRPNERARALVLVNPRVTHVSTMTDNAKEACLSCPGMTVEVPRARHVRVEYDNLTSDGYTAHTVQEFSGLTARIIEHEVDHLDGVTLITRAGHAAIGVAARTLQWALEQTEGARAFLRAHGQPTEVPT